MAKKDKDDYDNGNRKDVEERGNSGKDKKSKEIDGDLVDTGVKPGKACKNPPFCQDEVASPSSATAVKMKSDYPSFNRSTKLSAGVVTTNVPPGKRGYAPLKMRR